jgi:hypothetical protein
VNRVGSKEMQGIRPLAAIKSYLKPLPSQLPRVLCWIAAVVATVLGTIAIGLMLG